MKRIVVIGGTGNFGGRICRRIAAEPNTELIVTSRKKDRAEAVVSELRAANRAAVIAPAGLDQQSPEFEAGLLTLRPDLVIHTAGPYQGQDYRVARACIEARSHYIDLADGRRFVQGFDSLHDDARRSDLLMVSGASTVAAVLSYCGKPFRVLVDGQWITKHGWHDLRRYRYPDFGTRLVGACDVPDLGLLPDYVDGVDTVTFHAALEASWEQLALWNMGWVTRAGIVRTWDRFVPMFRRLSDRLIGLGSDVGGMHIKLSGISRDGVPKSVTWNLVARQNHGPEIPCSPALILARKLVGDQINTRGAMPSLGMFSMTDFENEMSCFDIEWGVDNSV